MTYMLKTDYRLADGLIDAGKIASVTGKIHDLVKEEYTTYIALLIPDELYSSADADDSQCSDYVEVGVGYTVDKADGEGCAKMKATIGAEFQVTLQGGANHAKFAYSIDAGGKVDIEDVTANQTWTSEEITDVAIVHGQVIHFWAYGTTGSIKGWVRNPIVTQTHCIAYKVHPLENE